MRAARDKSNEMNGLELSEYLPYRLSIVAERMSRRLAQEYGERYGLSQQEWRVLHILSTASARSTKEVIERTSLDRLRVSRAAQRLEAKDLIARVIHPTDQRAHLMQLTPKGRRVYDSIVPIALAMQERLEGALTAAQAKELFAILDRLDAALED